MVEFAVKNVCNCVFNFLGGNVCDFENSAICGYVQDRRDDFDWTRKSGRTVSSFTGPPSDHTYGTSRGENIEFNVQFQVFTGQGYNCEMHKI